MIFLNKWLSSPQYNSQKKIDSNLIIVFLWEVGVQQQSEGPKAHLALIGIGPWIRIFWLLKTALIVTITNNYEHTIVAIYLHLKFIRNKKNCR